MESYGSVTGIEPPKETLASLAEKSEGEDGKKRKYLKKATILDWVALTTTAATILLCNIVLMVAAYLHS